MATDKHPAAEPDPEASPFEPAPIEGMPFSKDSEEARAIREVIEQAERYRAAAKTK